MCCRLSRRALVGPVGPAPVAPGSPVRSPDAVRVRSSRRWSGPHPSPPPGRRWVPAGEPARVSGPPLLVTPPAGVSAGQPSRRAGAARHAACGGLTAPPYRSLRSLGGPGVPAPGFALRGPVRALPSFARSESVAVRASPPAPWIPAAHRRQRRADVPPCGPLRSGHRHVAAAMALPWVGLRLARSVGRRPWGRQRWGRWRLNPTAASPPRPET